MPTIKHCRRLSKAVVNKPQNLLVTLESLDHANIIISSAKQLRGSYNDFVRASVYINPDLTKAEAAAAYEERCRRRLHREERSSRQQLHQQQQQVSNEKSITVSSNPTAVRVSELSACSPSHSAGSSGSSGLIDSKLNASVAVFQPASVVQSTDNQAPMDQASIKKTPIM